MANTSSDLMMSTLADILEYANNTGSVNLYMAHGGTNFGYWAGELSLTCVEDSPLKIGTENKKSEHFTSDQLHLIRGWKHD